MLIKSISLRNQEKLYLKFVKIFLLMIDISLLKYKFSSTSSKQKVCINKVRVIYSKSYFVNTIKKIVFDFLYANLKVLMFFLFILQRSLHTFWFNDFPPLYHLLHEHNLMISNRLVLLLPFFHAS